MYSVKTRNRPKMTRPKACFLPLQGISILTHSGISIESQFEMANRYALTLLNRSLVTLVKRHCEATLHQNKLLSIKGSIQSIKSLIPTFKCFLVLCRVFFIWIVNFIYLHAFSSCIKTVFIYTNTYSSVHSCS